MQYFVHHAKFIRNVPFPTSALYTWKKASERLTDPESSQIHTEYMIKWKILVQQM